MLYKDISKLKFIFTGEIYSNEYQLSIEWYLITRADTGLEDWKLKNTDFSLLV